MSNFNHPFYSKLEDIEKKIDKLTKLNNHSKDPNHIILDSPEVAEILKISEGTLKNWREEGIIPYAKVNNKIYFTLADVIQLINKSKVKKK